MKIDCEGAEVEVLKGGEKTIRSAKPAIFLSTHGDALKQTCFSLLNSWGYTPSPLHGDDYLWVQKNYLNWPRVTFFPLIRPNHADIFVIHC